MRATVRSLLASAALFATAASPSVSAPAGSHTPQPAAAGDRLDHAAIARARFGNDAPWYEHRIPYFESADAKIDAVYYYRWSIFRAHQRDLGKLGYITTEFADDVDWQRHPYASLNDASGFHIAEGRWLNDRRFTGDYINFMYEGGNDRHFTDHMADSVWGRYLVDGDRAAVTRHLPVMRHIYGLWDDHYDFTKGLYFIEPLLDATEYTVSSIDASGGKDGFTGGDSFRPSINSYMFANARAISHIARLAGDEALADTFAKRAEGLRKRVLADLWNPKLDHFTDRYKADNEYVKYWEPVRARELVGYLPWMFDLVPDDPRYASAWAHLLDPASLAGQAGMRTVEKSYQYYMRQYRYLGTARECQWNGPVWPYQTTQVLTAMANLLDHYGNTGPVTRSAYMRLLRQYTALHYQGSRLDLEEDYDPATGKPIVGLDRSHHYFHSGYIDLILTGLVGIRPRADDVLEIDPLLPAAGDPQALAWFRAEDVPYHGHRIAVTWDADGSHYGRGKGLSIEVDGKEVARRATLGRLTTPVTRAPNRPIAREIDEAMQLVRGQFPKADASSNRDPESLHDAIDGRVWFYPELPNGWTSAASDDPQWYEVNFGKPVSLDATELAFFDDGKAISAPSSVAVETWMDKRWQPLARGIPVANGVTRLSWPKQSVSRLRVRMQPVQGRAIRLVELKAMRPGQ
ncbi:MGH1-like glycoside hydrolase domain-containing protein [Novosphingobium beihaiensis]|uniref:Discoidin domain-containing protein n=1 Tax=Novosphingobium beihaiensis TaxID=2930389 RepID=A0ABT0BRA9_9SPHN|nr:discoidin domain-containing protein [Novosphingobium beihaiensis]MCJ2187184.1 discoidin domain-containing protein [Novosphingobium beihaiensis]